MSRGYPGGTLFHYTTPNGSSSPGSACIAYGSPSACSLRHRRCYGARQSSLSSLLNNSSSGSPSDGTTRAARGFPASSVKRSNVP
jgi:hypothetical protein